MNTDSEPVQNSKQAANFNPVPAKNQAVVAKSFSIDREHNSNRGSFLVYDTATSVPKIKIAGRIVPLWYLAPVGLFIFIFLVYFIMSS